MNNAGPTLTPLYGFARLKLLFARKPRSHADAIWRDNIERRLWGYSYKSQSDGVYPEPLDPRGLVVHIADAAAACRLLVLLALVSCGFESGVIYPIPTQEAGNALITVRSRVCMGSGDHLLSDSHPRSPL
ncbi:hypothetical protein EVAR_87023_1 [Eumeta japonica]|uniref:Uncharacterized protein n=1 Tax=Eumeta variegata TaxID=151549 RepID=A0A4C1YZX9_EUMVA|nr:hypothetical protein EVAR_87023_1 [Eumeta japonica]